MRHIDLERCAAAIKKANSMLILAGAGMGADSGLATFRGTDGFWNTYPAIGRTGKSFKEFASPSTFEETPELAWGFYGQRLNEYRAADPHAGFQILRRWVDRMDRGHFVFTTNVDAHFQKAGFSQDRVVEYHGSLEYAQHFLNVEDSKIFPVPSDLSIKVDPDTLEADLQTVPRDPETGELLRPNVCLFHDPHWMRERQYEQLGRYRYWKQFPLSPLVIVEIGAGTAIPTARFEGRNVHMAETDSTYIRINPDSEQFARDYANFIHLKAGALEALEAIDELLSE